MPAFCPVCQEEVDPEAPDTVRLTQRRKVETFGDGPAQYVEDMPTLFHKRHAPRGGGWVTPSD